jgi:hypothetical protein
MNEYNVLSFMASVLAMTDWFYMASIDETVSSFDTVFARMKRRIFFINTD